jgi:hypothetical protein
MRCSIVYIQKAYVYVWSSSGDRHRDDNKNGSGERLLPLNH